MILDIERALQQVGGDHEILRDVLELYSRDTFQKLEEMSRALREKDFDRLRRLAHSVKGASASIAADSVAEYAMQIEKSDHETNPEFFTGHIDGIERELKKVKSEIRKYLESDFD